jgi:hypothetical protein
MFICWAARPWDHSAADAAEDRRYKNQVPNKFQNLNPKGLIVVWFLVIGFLVLPAATHAQAVQLVPCSGINCTVDDLLRLLVNVYNFLLGFAALAAMLFIVWGGLRMLYFSFLEDSAHELASAKLTVRRAVAGFVIIALAYLIVNTVLSMLGLATGTEIYRLLQQFGLR